MQKKIQLASRSGCSQDPEAPLFESLTGGLVGGYRAISWPN